ncbi:hypothetical protein AVEN_83555-1 [Araneus ventricosus]|uniref:Uncharacterized protein n=1 Tax=Araneus ventricosus TaxID=182803 RepID=A0A4Y2WJL0_ARAVE|nr:hypothetical protein AVEN_83555-1 [Araneus ventricosus]
MHTFRRTTVNVFPRSGRYCVREEINLPNQFILTPARSSSHEDLVIAIVGLPAFYLPSGPDYLNVCAEAIARTTRPDLSQKATRIHLGKGARTFRYTKSINSTIWYILGLYMQYGRVFIKD